MSILGLFVLGPIFHQVEKVILSLTTTVLYLPFGLGGLIIGGTSINRCFWCSPYLQLVRN